MIAKFFIERPVLANVIAILMVLHRRRWRCSQLPIAQYPDVMPPTVQVTTRYPGASARTVSTPSRCRSSSRSTASRTCSTCSPPARSDGTYSLIVTFKIGTDPNFAQVLVQNRVASARRAAAAGRAGAGRDVQKKSTSILLFVTLTSPDGRYDSLFLATTPPSGSRTSWRACPASATSTVFGAGQYSHARLARPRQAPGARPDPAGRHPGVQQQSQQVTAGQVGMPPTPAAQDFQYTLNVAGRLNDAADFENIIVKTGDNGEITRVRDVGRVELGAQTYSQIFTLERQAGGRHRRSSSRRGRTRWTSPTRSRRGWTTLAKDFPQGLVSTIPFDTTIFVTQSINEVYKTLIEAGVLVLIVILVFLQDWRAMLVPATTVPVTIIGAFAAMAALGFTRQSLDAVRHRAGDRHRGRRRHRRGGGRRAPYREGHVRRTMRRSRRWTSCSGRSSASRWC